MSENNKSRHRRGKKLSAEDSGRILDELLPEYVQLNPDGCPTLREQAINTVIEEYIRNTKEFGKLNTKVRKAIVSRVDDMVESLDKKNIGKSRVVWIPNPSFDQLSQRTDSDKDKGKGDNPFFVKSYESVYDPYRYKDNIVEANFARILKLTEDQMKQIQNLKKELYKEIRAMERAKQDLESDDQDQYDSNESLIDLDFDEDSISIQ